MAMAAVGQHREGALEPTFHQVPGERLACLLK
jgi:hypothetical protein